MMDLQMTFDHVVQKLLAQNKRAMIEAPGKMPVLMYRTPDGLVDAIGSLIPEALYDPDMEGYAFKGTDTWKQYDSNGGLAKLHEALIQKGVYADDPKVLRLLTDLQHVHDGNAPEFWIDRLRAVARTWRLSTDTLEGAVLVRAHEEWRVDRVTRTQPLRWR